MDAATLLAWLVEDRHVRVPISRLAEVNGEAGTREAIAELTWAGQITEWVDAEHDDAPTLTLTAFAAEAHKLAMSEDLDMWLRPSQRRKPTRLEITAEILEADAMPHTTPEEDAEGKLRANLDKLPDPKAKSPAKRAEEIEQAEADALAIETWQREREIMARLGRRHPCSDNPVTPLISGVPHPMYFLGCEDQWTNEDFAICPTCGGTVLESLVYCLRCSRYGLDHLLPRVKIERIKRVLPDGRGLKGGVGTKARGKKSKKKAKS